MIRFECECGKLLQARDENAGKLAVCPACQRQLTVPADALPPESVQRERPTLRDERAFEEKEAIQDRPRRRQPSGNSGKAIASLVLGILSLFCSVFAGLPALLLGILALRDIGRSNGRLSGHGLAIGGIVSACICTLISCGTAVPISIALLLPAVQKVREAAGRAQSMNNLKQMSIALLNYNDTYGTLPPAGFGDPSKPVRQRRPFLSWRVAILPFVEQQALYNQFKLDEPWDGPNNIKLLARMPAIFALPGDTQTPSDHTHYQVFVGNGAAFDRLGSHNIPAEFLDGLANTILMAVAERAVPWTKPEDVNFDPRQPIRPLLSTYFQGAYQVSLADGSILMLDRTISETTLKAAITRNGGEILGPDWRSR